MKIKVFALVVLLALLCCGCSTDIGSLSGQKFERSEITTDYGDKIIVTLNTMDFPDFEQSINVIAPDGNHESIHVSGGSYNYENNESYDVIIHQYKDEKTRAYEFYWGLVYTIDNGKNFSIVKKEDYEHIYNFKDIYDLTT